MKKSELLSALSSIRHDQCRTRGLYTVIQMLINYFSDERIPEYEYTGIFYSLPKHVVRAVDNLRTSKDPRSLRSARHTSRRWMAVRT